MMVSYGLNQVTYHRLSELLHCTLPKATKHCSWDRMQQPDS